MIQPLLQQHQSMKLIQNRRKAFFVCLICYGCPLKRFTPQWIDLAIAFQHQAYLRALEHSFSRFGRSSQNKSYFGYYLLHYYVLICKNTPVSRQKPPKCSFFGRISWGPKRQWFTLWRMSAVRVRLSPTCELSRYKAI